MCAGFLNPKIMGPTDSDPSICFNNLYVMFADSKLGKIKTLTFLPFNLEKGNIYLGDIDIKDLSFKFLRNHLLIVKIQMCEYIQNR